MKEFKEWLWKEGEEEQTKFYSLDFTGKRVTRAWGEIGNIRKARILDIEHNTEREAWAAFEILRLKAEAKEGKVPIDPAARKLYGDVPALFLGQIHETKDYPEGAHKGCFTSAIPSYVLTRMVDQEDTNLLLIKHKKDNQLAEEFQQDLAFHKRIYGESEEYYSNLLRFYVFLEKRQK